MRKKHREAAQSVGSFKTGSYFQAHALLSPGRGAEQVETDHVKIEKLTLALQSFSNIY